MYWPRTTRRRIERADRPQDLDLLVADSVRGIAAGGLHRQHRDDLEHVVLDHVADRAGLFVEGAPTLHAEDLGHRDLHALDAIAVPDRLEELVGEPERQDVEDRLLAQVVVDPEDSRFVKRLRGGCALSSRADSSSRPNGFSITTRALSAQPDLARFSTTVPNRLGGIAR